MAAVKTKPLYRSVTFWSGVLTMGFIGWAWWDSMRAHVSLDLDSCWAEHGAGGIAAGVARSPSADPWWERDFVKSTVSKRDEPDGGIVFGFNPPSPATPFPSPLVHSGDGVSAFIPHWLILLVVVVPWSGLLLWRARRIKRAHRAIP